MAEKNIRIGRVSSIDYGSGMISVTYPDLDDSVTDDLPVFSMGDEYKMPPVGAEVLVLHLSNGCAAGVVMGRYWNEANKPSVSGKGVFRQGTRREKRGGIHPVQRRKHDAEGWKRSNNARKHPATALKLRSETVRREPHGKDWKLGKDDRLRGEQQ